MQPRRTPSRILIVTVAFITLITGPAIFAAPDTAIVAATGGLRMRSAPDLNADRIFTIPDGATVSVRQTRGAALEISGKRGQWTEVEFGGKTGWVFGGFLRAAPANESQEQLSPRDQAVLKKIRALTGVTVPEKSDPVRDAEQYDPALFAVLKKQTAGEITVFTIAPNGKECAHYGSSDCINVIAGKNKTYITSDIFRRSFGFPDTIKAGVILFRVVLGEGDVCSAGGEGTTTAYIIAKQKFFLQTWSSSQTCTCCTGDDAGSADCPCNQFTQTNRVEYSGLDGEKIVVTPAIERLFRSDDAGR